MNIVRTTLSLVLLASSVAVAAMPAAPLGGAGICEAHAQSFSDSTGGSSAAHAERLLEHAQASSAFASQPSRPANFQPNPDSTGGSSAASAERVFNALDGTTRVASAADPAAAQSETRAAR